MSDIDPHERTRMLLAALDAGPQARRSRFRDLEIRCGRCGEIIAEVVALPPDRVLRFRATADDPTDPAAPSFRDEVDRLRAAGVFGVDAGRRAYDATRPGSRNIRRGPRSFVSLPWPRPERLAPAPRVNPDEAIPTTLAEAVCDCHAWHLDEGAVYDLLERQTRRTVWRPESDDRVT